MEILKTIADEVFISFNAEDFDKNRLYSGFYIELSKNIRADVFYLRQSSKSGGDWKDANVVGAYLKFYFLAFGLYQLPPTNQDKANSF